MGISVTLVGARLTDGTQGRLALSPRGPWLVTSGTTTSAPGPMFFRITSSGTLETLTGSPATIVPTRDSSSVMVFTPSGSSYLARINIAGQQTIETWTVDGANDTVDWAALGIKPNATDRINVTLPMTTESPVPKYALLADLPSGNYKGRLAFVQQTDGFYGNNGTTWVRLD